MAVRDGGNLHSLNYDGGNDAGGNDGAGNDGGGNDGRVSGHCRGGPVVASDQ